MKTLMTATQVAKAVAKLAAEIEVLQGDLGQAAFVGIHTRGIVLAARVAAELTQRVGRIPQGTLDINLYRDDLSRVAESPVIRETRIDFSVDGRVIYLFDDVLYTGRTIRAAMDAIFDLGRPRAIFLTVLAKRRGRELPIEANFCALEIATGAGDDVQVKFCETDGVDEVVLTTK